MHKVDAANDRLANHTASQDQLIEYLVWSDGFSSHHPKSLSEASYSSIPRHFGDAVDRRTPGKILQELHFVAIA